MLPRVPNPVPFQGMEERFSPAAAGETVLLVEDSTTVRKAAQRIFTECGYKVLEAGSGAEAISVAQNNPNSIDLLVADLVMLGMSGRELGPALRAEHPELPSLYMSGYEPQDSAAEDSEEPIVFFRKPFTGAALLGKVREILDAKRLTNSMKSETRKRELP